MDASATAARLLMLLGEGQYATLKDLIDAHDTHISSKRVRFLRELAAHKECTIKDLLGLNNSYRLNDELIPISLWRWRFRLRRALRQRLVKLRAGELFELLQGNPGFCFDPAAKQCLREALRAHCEKKSLSFVLYWFELAREMRTGDSRELLMEVLPIALKAKIKDQAPFTLLALGEREELWFLRQDILRALKPHRRLLRDLAKG